MCTRSFQQDFYYQLSSTKNVGNYPSSQFCRETKATKNNNIEFAQWLLDTNGVWSSHGATNKNVENILFRAEQGSW